MQRALICAVAVALFAACGDSSGGDQGGGGGGKLGTLDDVQLRVTPASVSFGGVSQGKSASVTVRISHVGTSGTATLSAARLESATAEITAELPADTPLAPGEGVDLVVRFTAADGLPDTAQLLVDHDAAGLASPLVIPISTGSVEGVLRLSPDLVDFGTVATGGHADRVATVTNVGSGDLTLDTVALEGDAIEDFAVTEPPALPATLAPGASLTVGLRYTPTWWNGDTGTLVVTAGALTASVPLLGAESGPKIVVSPPDKVALGSAQVGDEVSRAFKVLSQGNAPLHVSEVRLLPGAEPGLTLEGAPGGEVTLAPGEKIDATVRFQPTKALPPDGTDPIGIIRVASDDPVEPAIEVPVYAWSGYPILSVLPAEQLHFGVCAQTIPITRTVTLLNEGFAPLDVTEIRLTADTGAEFEILGDPSFGPLATPPTSGFVMPGETVTVAVVFTNFGDPEGEATGGLALHSSDDEHPVWIVDLYALRAGPPECKPVLAPATLDFGPVSEGSSTVATVTIKNEGSGFCSFVATRTFDCPDDLPGTFACTQDASSPFFAVVAEPAVVEAGIEPKGSAAIQLRFDAPELAGDDTWHDVRGLLQVDIADPHHDGAVTTLPVPFTPELQPVPNLAGSSALGLLSVEPSSIAFGLVTLGCSSQTKTVTITNKGDAPLLVGDIALTGCTPETTIVEMPGLPHEVSAGTLFEVAVAYAPQDLGADSCMLSISAGGQAASVALAGAGTLETHVTDVFDKVFDGVDVLFVVDDSGSMSEDQQNLAENFGAFLDAASSWGVDFHLGVVTTDIEDATKAGRLQGEPPFVTSATASAFTKNVMVGTSGSGTECGLEAARLALSPPLTSDLGTTCQADAECAAPAKCVAGKCGGPNVGFLRPQAALHVVFVSDEEDYSPKAHPSYVDFLLGLKGEGWGELVKAHAIVGTKALPCLADVAQRYIAVADATGGKVASICDPDFAKALSDLSGGIFGAQYKYHLSRFPEPTTIEVLVNGAKCTSGWTFDAASQAVVFSPSSPCMPAPGDIVTISYDAMCF